jgi:hypothetical protein
MFLFIVLFVSESLSLTIEEERIEDVSERNAEDSFGPKRDEVTEGYRILHNGELHNLYSSSNIIRLVKSRRQIM